MQSGGTLWFGSLMLLPDRAAADRTAVAAAAGRAVSGGRHHAPGAYGLYTWGVSRIPVSQAGMFLNLIPVFTLMLAWALLGRASQSAAVGGVRADSGRRAVGAVAGCAA